MSARPRLTVVTIGRNNLHGLRETLDSVDRQTYPELHHLIVDGASTDGSAQYLHTLPGRPTRRWLSEPDAGIYDAMNKALDRVETEYLLYLNAGDTFVDDDAVARTMRAIAAAPRSPDIAIGWSRFVAGGKELPYVVGGATPKAITSAQESTVFATAFHRTEPYDTTLGLGGDYALFRRLATRGEVDILRLDFVISHFVFGGRSNDLRYDGARFLERARIDARFGEVPTVRTYLQIAARMLTRRAVYSVAGADRAARVFLRIACRRGNSGARRLPLGEIAVPT